MKKGHTEFIQKMIPTYKVDNVYCDTCDKEITHDHFTVCFDDSYDCTQDSKDFCSMECLIKELTKFYGDHPADKTVDIGFFRYVPTPAMDFEF